MQLSLFTMIKMLDKFFYKTFEGIDNIMLSIDNWCDERYKNVRDFFNKKRKRRKTKKSIS
mgnify:FL=1